METENSPRPQEYQVDMLLIYNERQDADDIKNFHKHNLSLRFCGGNHSSLGPDRYSARFIHFLEYHVL